VRYAYALRGKLLVGSAARPFQVAAKAEKGQARPRGADRAEAGSYVGGQGIAPVHVPLSARRARIRALRPAAARGSTARVLLLGRAWRDCGR